MAIRRLRRAKAVAFGGTEGPNIWQDGGMEAAACHFNSPIDAEHPLPPASHGLLEQ